MFVNLFLFEMDNSISSSSSSSSSAASSAEAIASLSSITTSNSITSIPTVSTSMTIGSNIQSNHDNDTIYIISVSLTLGILTFMTIIGNVFVIAAIIMERNLRTTANYLVLSLAVADLMVACFVMPLGAVAEIRQQWSLGTFLCDIWTSSDVLCCTASILHLLAIALDRYWAVTYVDYIHKRTPQRICLMIFTVWTVAAIVSIAPLFGWKDPDFNVRVEQEKRCLISQDIGYQVFATISSFFGPLIFILLLYWKIYQVARKRIRHKPGKTITPATTCVNPKTMIHIDDEISTKKFSFKEKIFAPKKPPTPVATFVRNLNNNNIVQDEHQINKKLSISTNSPNQDDGDTNNNNSMAKNQGQQPNGQQQEFAINEKCLCELNASRLSVEHQHKQHNHRTNHNHHHNLGHGTGGCGGGHKCSLVTTISSSTTSSSSSSSSSETMIMESQSKVPNLTKKYSSSQSAASKSMVMCISENDVSMSPALISNNLSSASVTHAHQQHLNEVQMRKAIKESIESKRERKAAKILAIITGIFVICWLPFFVMALLMPLCKNCQPSKYIFSIFLWLGYLNSLLNPIIYTIFSPDFRNGFRRILCGKKRR